ncbi:PepSY domain-containing protein [Shewanella sp. 202IG2-18]|uniref:PepSY-associated TM helix domain-containing protein n=1 Tax=Parashewanella hymeniacidonis TaxID=2807618 RepID=UPI001960E7D1|nr:PepSY-associated TM helix domain-containing protein [Parashewanella hymeniacidonis]MBM7074515.1 PepSY domain-containing protein [Parashewanella hymeniacidonis]
MNIKKTFFWLHLVLGCSAAIFIFLMSITGLALTYERQIIKFAEQKDYPVKPDGIEEPLSIEKIKNISQNYPTEKQTSLKFINEIDAPIQIKDGRKTLAYLNPYTGEKITELGDGTKSFFKHLRAFHRWLSLDGKFSSQGRWVNGISNVIFIFIIVSGIYLWLPKRFNRRAFKQKLTLTGSYPSSKARDYQWHNVFGIYMAPALFVIAFTAIFFSFKWPGQVLKENVSTISKTLPKPTKVATPHFSHDVIEHQLMVIKESNLEWKSIQFGISDEPVSIHTYQIDNGNGAEPHKRHTAVFDNATGKIIATQDFDSLSEYSQLRSIIRFLHTGEILGIIGQTIAGLASLLACLLAYTGITLSWRRYKASTR